MVSHVTFRSLQQVHAARKYSLPAMDFFIFALIVGSHCLRYASKTDCNSKSVYGESRGGSSKVPQCGHVERVSSGDMESSVISSARRNGTDTTVSNCRSERNEGVAVLVDDLCSAISREDRGVDRRRRRRLWVRLGARPGSLRSAASRSGSGAYLNRSAGRVSRGDRGGLLGLARRRRRRLRRDRLFDGPLRDGRWRRRHRSGPFVRRSNERLESRRGRHARRRRSTDRRRRPRRRRRGCVGRRLRLRGDGLPRCHAAPGARRRDIARFCSCIRKELFEDTLRSRARQGIAEHVTEASIRFPVVAARREGNPQMQRLRGLALVHVEAAQPQLLAILAAVFGLGCCELRSSWIRLVRSSGYRE